MKMYIIFISNIAGFYTYIKLVNIFTFGEIKTKQQNKKCPSEGSNSEPSTYENDALTSRPLTYTYVRVILKSSKCSAT